MRKHLQFSVIAVALITLCASFTAKAKQIVTVDANASVKVATNHKWKKSFSSVSDFKKNKIGTRDVMILGPTQDYSFVTNTDGSQWYATQNYTVKSYYYTSSVISLYNSKGEKQSEINVTVPEGKSCNQIMIGESITANLFDKNSSSHELSVVLHLIHSPGVTSYVTYVYDVATGEQVGTYDGLMSVVKYYTGYSYDAVGILSYSSEKNGEKVSNYGIYYRAALKHTFSVPNKLAEYQVGGVLNVFEVDNNLYYVVSQYEKEFLDPASYEEPWDMIPTADNNFTATIYNKNFKQQAKISLPVTSTPQYLVQYGIGLFGFKDLSNNFWDESGELRLVVTKTGFEVNTEKEDIAFYVHDTDGNVVKTIAENVSNWMNMYDIPGEPSQMVFLTGGATAMSMVNLPSCETAVTFGAEIEGNAISTNIDRCPVGDSYKYVIGLPSPDVDNEGNIHQRYAWVNKNGTLDRIVKFNVGPTNANWTPLVLGEVLSPYIFDTDSEREYIFIANQRVAPNAIEMIDEVRIVKEDGTIVRSYVEDANTKGDLGSCALLGLDSELPTIVVPYYNSNTDEINIEMEFLPYASMSAGGEGTAENPYLITSAGDMALISRNPSAHYKVVNNFDAGDWGAWKGIANFDGTFDGGNHTISNLALDGDTEYVGMFASTGSAEIRNLVLQSPRMHLTDKTFSAGFVVSESVSDTICNVHIKEAEIIGNGAIASIGAIAGKSMFTSLIERCSASDLCVDAPMSSVGGIVGATLTSSLVRTCSVTADINAGSIVGGVVGSAGTGCSVNDCAVNVTIVGENTIGGVAGEAERGGIFNCFVKSNLTATNAMQGYAKLGGIAGSLTSDWEAEEAEYIDSVVAGNVVKIEAINAPEMKGVHRIIGYSRYEEDLEAKRWDSSIVPMHELALDNNYVIGGSEVVDSTIAATITSTEGADLTESDFNQAMLETIGFKFGTSADAPWCFAANPYLYYENPEYSAIEAVVAEKSGVKFDGTSIVATGAVKVELYSIAGVKVAMNNGEELLMNGVTAGVYVVVATDAEGAKTTAKIMVK